MVAVFLFTNDWVHPTFTHNVVFRLIPGIKIQVLPFVAFLYKRFYDIGVMYACVSGGIRFYELGLLVCLDMSLVAIMRLTTFLRVSCVCVLVAFLVWLVVPQTIAIASLYLLVLLGHHLPKAAISMMPSAQVPLLPFFTTVMPYTRRRR